MAVLILLTVPAGLVMVQSGLERSVQDVLFIYHKNIGVLLLVLTLVRLWVRRRWSPPPPASDLPRWQRVLGVTIHRAFYMLLVVVTIAGFVRVRADGYPIESLDALGVPVITPQSEELAALAKSVHYFAGLVFIAAMVMHIGAAVYHGVRAHDGVFARMWPPLGGRGR